MKMRSILCAVCAAVFMLFLMAPTQTVSAADDVITIGYSGPLSGGGAKFGKNLQMGLDLAADQVNAMGGLDVAGKKYSVRVVSMDDQFQTALTVSNAKRLVHKEGAKMIFNPSSGGIFGLMSINEREKFIVCAYTTNQICVTSGNKLLYRGPPSMLAYVQAWADRAMEKHGWKTCAMMQGAYDYGKIWSGLFEKYWVEKGGTITCNIPVDWMRVSDYYPLLTKALATNPDCILLGSSSEPDAMQIQQARELGFKGGFVIIERGKLDEMEKFVKDTNVLNGCIGTAPLYFYPQKNAKKFIKRFGEKYGKDVVIAHESSIAYGSVMYYLGGMQLAGTTTDVYKIMDAMKSPELMKVPLVKENDVYENEKIYPNGAVKGNILGVEFIKGKYSEPFPVATPEWIWTEKY